VRSFFDTESYIEVHTPLLIDAPLPERHIDAFSAPGGYLITSPEPCMKMLLADGLERIYQITPCFRQGETGARHSPEFVMLEWYRTGARYCDLVDDARGLLCHIAGALNGMATLNYAGHRVALDGEWEWLSVDDAYRRVTGRGLSDLSDDFLFDEAMARIEPALGLTVPCVLHDYPATQSPMSLPCVNNPGRAQRLELYVAGVELANGCTELRDAALQAKNLRREREARQAAGKDPYPWPERFLERVGEMPPCAGMALGIDRLVMLMCDVETVAEARAFSKQ
jgi:lysyl-tRNA synthetase class 2